MTFKIDTSAPYVSFPSETIGSQSLNPAGRGSHFLPRRFEDAIGRIRILVVEEDGAIGPLLAEMLEDLGAIVCGVEVDLDRAPEAAARCHPDLMIIDVGLGATRNVDAVKKILLEGLIPCVFVTDANLRECTLWPGAVLIRKPFRATDIVAAIGRAMAGIAGKAS